MIERFGGSFTEVNGNVIHPGALEAMLIECQGIYFGEEHYPSIIDKAAMLCWRIIKGHVFWDGNKRTGVQVCRAVLYLQGYILPFDEAMRDAALAIAKGELALEDFTEWLVSVAVQS
jgi:death-on-curing protein